MLKKIIAFLLVLALTLTFVACGGSTNDKKDDSSSKDQTSSKEESKNSSTSSDTQSSTPSSVTSKPQKDNSLWTRKMVALTFDDSPFGDTGALLDLLKEKNVKATFFMIGEHMEQYPEIVERAISEGHDVGYHSYSHNINNTTPQNIVSADFNKAQSIIDGINPDYQITLYRGPGGSASAAMKEEAVFRNWRLIGWTNYGFKDSTKEVISPEDRMKGVYETPSGPNLRNGEIVLIHPYENCPDIITGIGLFIDKLRADGYEPVQMSELLKRRNGGKAGTAYNLPIY